MKMHLRVLHRGTDSGTPSSALFQRVRRLTLLCLALLPAAAGAQCKLQAFEIPITLKQWRAVAHVRINETDVPLLLDSGAFFSFLTDAAADQLKLRLRPAPKTLQVSDLTGRVDFHVARVERLGVSGVEVQNVEFMVGSDEPGVGAMGLLGRNLLGKDAEYDLANGLVRLMQSNSDCTAASLAYWAGTAPVVELPLIKDWDERSPPIRAQAKVNGKTVTALFDTGASMSVLSLAAARRIGVAGDSAHMPSPHFVKRPRGQEQPVWRLPTESFELGAERITNIRLNVMDMSILDDTDMLIGLDFFLSHRIYLDRSHDRMLFTYSGGPVFNVSEEAAAALPADTDDAGAPHDAAALARRSAILAMRGELARALSDLDRAVELAPAVAAYREQRAGVKQSLHQRQAALADFDEALHLDPQADEARMDRAWLRLEDGAVDLVKADLQVLDAHLAPQSHMRRSMGSLFARIHEPLLAVRQYDQWVNAHPKESDLADVLSWRCWARALANTQLDQALKDCDQALEVQPKQASYLGNRGLVQLRLGQWEKAIADYDAALALNQKLPWSLWGRGLARLRAGARDLGLRDLAEAKATNSTIEADTRGYGLAVPGDKGTRP